MSRAPVSVGQLTSYIAELFRYDEILGDVWVEGEVTSHSLARSGHHYFKLSDGGALVSCVLFQQKAQLQTHLPEAGERFILHGSVGVYEASGVYQLYVDVVQPVGLGLMALEFARLRLKLQEEGLFEPSRKRPLPPFPQRIGVVTSAVGSVWQDIQNVIRRRYPLVELLLAHTQVQGSEAPERIVSALQLVSSTSKCELIILARGGGSAEDLACFNDERVVRAIFACPVPVVSAIGHETDWTLSDEVADLRAPTPSAAAELATPSIDELIAAIELYREAVHAGIQGLLRPKHDELQLLIARVERSSPRQRAELSRREIIHLTDRAAALMLIKLNNSRGVVALLDQQLMFSRQSACKPSLARWQLSNARLQSLNPIATLARGYAVLENAHGVRIASATQARIGEEILGRLVDGNLSANVTEVVPGRELLN